MPHKKERALPSAGGADAAREGYDLYLKGREYFQHFHKADNLDKAIESLQKAVERDPSCAPAHTLLGEAYWRKYESTKLEEWVTQSRKSCLRAVELNDRHAAVAHANLGVVYAGTGRSEEALREFRASLGLNPVNDDCWRGLAGTYQALGSHSEAEAFHKAATGPGTHSWKGRSHLGVLYYNQGRYREAEEQFNQIPQHEPIRAKLLGGLYLAMRRYEESAQLLEQALADGAPGVYNNLARAYLLLGRPQDAIGMAGKAIAARPNDYRYRGTLAEIYASLSDRKAHAAYNEAIEFAQQQLAINRRNGEVWSDLAVYQAKTGKKEDALDSIEKALKYAPGDVDVTQNALIVYETTHNRALALGALQAAVQRGQPIEAIQSNYALVEFFRDDSYQRLIKGQSGDDRSATARV